MVLKLVHVQKKPMQKGSSLKGKNFSPKIASN